MIWFTSDLHFGHAKIIEHCVRPYKDVDEMNEAIVKQWNSQVKPDDTVYILGDFSLQPKYCTIFLPRLNGTKHLISGNHDSTFPYNHGRHNKKMESMIKRYLNEGFTSIQLKGSLELSRYHGWRRLFSKKYKVELSHFPFGLSSKYAYNCDKRYMEMRPIDSGQILLSGHQHSKYIKHHNNIDVGFDGSLKLYSEQDIIDLIEDKREFIPSRVTEFYKSQHSSNNDT